MAESKETSCGNCCQLSGSLASCEIKEGRKLGPEIEAKLNVLLGVGEECVTRDELALLLERKPNFIAYDGFEPSGRMHIAQVTLLVYGGNFLIPT